MCRILKDGKERATASWSERTPSRIAGFASRIWVRGTRDYLKATELLGLENFPKTIEWADRMAARPASVRGLTIPEVTS